MLLKSLFHAVKWLILPQIFRIFDKCVLMANECVYAGLIIELHCLLHCTCRQYRQAKWATHEYIFVVVEKLLKQQENL